MLLTDCQDVCDAGRARRVNLLNIVFCCAEEGAADESELSSVPAAGQPSHIHALFSNLVGGQKKREGKKQTNVFKSAEATVSKNTKYVNI